MRQFFRSWVAVLVAAGWAGPVAAQPSIVLDYSYDTNNFFPENSTQRATLQAAATTLTSRLADTLGAITPGAMGTWTVDFSHPGTGAVQTIVDMNLPAHEIRVFAGGRELGGSTLGVGGFGGVTASGTTAFNTSLLRGQAGAGGATNQRTDFAPWGGAISFDSVGTTWNYALTGPSSGENDFYSVALHELGHLLGIGTAFSWDNLVIPGTPPRFNGAVSRAANGGVNPQVTGDFGHWASGTMSGGQEAAMTPSIVTGTRKLFTELDFAGLDDLGWQVTPVPEPTSLLGFAAAGLAAWRVRRRR